MNRHFHDTAYYLKRAGEHAGLGLTETLEPAIARVHARLGREPEPEPSRIEELLEEVRELETRAEGEAREALGAARERLEFYRAAE